MTTPVQPPLRKRVKRFVRYVFIRVLLVPLQLLPLRAASWLGERLGVLAFTLARGERKKALASLQTAMPDRTEAHVTAGVSNSDRILTTGQCTPTRSQ